MNPGGILRPQAQPLTPPLSPLSLLSPGPKDSTQHYGSVVSTGPPLEAVLPAVSDGVSSSTLAAPAGGGPGAGEFEAVPSPPAPPAPPLVADPAGAPAPGAGLGSTVPPAAIFLCEHFVCWSAPRITNALYPRVLRSIFFASHLQFPETM